VKSRPGGSKLLQASDPDEEIFSCGPFWEEQIGEYPDGFSIECCTNVTEEIWGVNTELCGSATYRYGSIFDIEYFEARFDLDDITVPLPMISAQYLEPACVTVSHVPMCVKISAFAKKDLGDEQNHIHFCILIYHEDTAEAEGERWEEFCGDSDYE